ncbi:BcPKS1, polyketide synthase [Xylaria intraflava]|nr:BcPKS1, polyketide synthase [Xylaria intraflava]
MQHSDLQRTTMSSTRINGNSPETSESTSPSLEPLAIVGFSLRFPQDADTPEGFWRVLEHRQSLMTEWPEDRMKLDAFYHRDTGRKKQTYVPGAHFLKEDLGRFDAPFFGISATEAMAMDPQHRILLEVTYHALERAGIPMEHVYGSKTGVYTGSMSDDYKHIVFKDPEDVPKYGATGLTMNMIANRISWFYNFLGPSVNLDSACSSSLMALDFASQGLRNRDCNMAVVAGSNLVLATENVVGLNNMEFLSPSGRCFSFDDRADGYSRGEGFGVILMKRLDDAIHAGDTIRAVVRSTGSNQDGHTPGLTQPSRESQARLIRETYEKAGLKLSETRFFEAHGTGTAVGDPTEASSIGSVFMSTRSKESLLFVGALKSNIGHLEGASGIASIIKTIMVLEKGIIPPNANFEETNRQIDAEFFNITFPTKCTPWPSPGLRRASVASFGFGGSNSHVVLDDAYHYLLARGLKGNHETFPRTMLESGADLVNNTGTHSGLSLQAQADYKEPMNTEYSRLRINQTGGKSNDATNGTCPIVKTSDMEATRIGMTSSDVEASTTQKILIFSANDENGIFRLSAEYQAFFDKNIDLARDPSYFDRLAHTLSKRRSMLTWKSFALVKSPLDLCNLDGQGAQYENMGAELMAYLSFRSAIEQFDQCLAEIGCTCFIDEPEYSQSMTTALQIALYELLQSFGLRPAVVIGHSSGEIAAAYATGALGKYASVLKSSSPSAGGMMAVDLSEDAMRAFISERGFEDDKLCIACINSPDNTTISGDALSLDIIGTQLESENIRVHKLKTGVASVEMSYAFQFSKAILTMLSYSGTSQPPKLSSARADTIQDIVEIGPRAALRRPFQACLRSTLERGISATQTIMSLSGGLYSRGHLVDVSKALANLPSYPFDHSKRYWFESPLSRQSLADWNALQPRWRKFFDLSETPWVGHHEINGKIVYPATGMLVMAIEGVTQLVDNNREITGETARQEVQLSLRPDRSPKNGDWFENSRGLIQAEFIKGNTSRNQEIQQCESAFYRRQVNTKQITCFQWTPQQSEHDRQRHLMWVALTNGANDALFDGSANHKGLRKTDCSIMEMTAVGGNEQLLTLDWKPDIDLIDRFHLESLTKIELSLFYFATMASEEGLLCGGSAVDSKTHLKKYIGWLKLQLHKHHVGQLAHSNPSWDTRIRDTESMKQLINRLKVANTEGRLLMTVGENLKAIISGVVDPLGLMFESGLAESHYQHMCQKMTCCKRLAKYLDALSHKYPQMKVLEVGAGTGSLTEHILRSLIPPAPDGSEGTIRLGQYVYTDISAAFFEQARDRFTEFNTKMKYSVLNIEHEVEIQGYELAAYDLVVAAWVLHATRDLATTIRNVRRLLRPGGKLVLLEITEPNILRNGFAFGTLPGWWLSNEPEREWSPCVPADQWRKLLVQNGFEGVDIILPDYENPICQENSIIIATNARQENLPDLDAGSNSTIVLINTESCLQRAVGGLVRKRFTSEDTKTCDVRSITDPSLIALPRGSNLVYLVELDRPYLSTLDKTAFENLQILISRAGRLAWITCSDDTASYSPELHIARGFARALCTENPNRPFITLNFESVGLEAEFYAQHICQVISGSLSNELEYVERNNTLLIGRVFESQKLNHEVHSKTRPTVQHQPASQSGPLAMTIVNPGLLDSFYWEEDIKYSEPLAMDEIEIAVEALGVNFRDVFVALGRYDDTFGLECAGTITRVGTHCQGFQIGDRVCAATIGCGRTHARCHYQLAVNIPNDMTVMEAASLPVTGITAYHSLVTLANLKKEDSILIHSAAGGTGQMALQIAQSIGAEIYVTVGTTEKRELMKDVYGLPDTHIFYSRDTAFSRHIYHATNGRGVDVVLNSLAGDLLVASWECIAPLGRFIELGKVDIEGNSKLPMSHFHENVTFSAISVDSLIVQRPLMTGKALKAVMDLISKKVIKPASPLGIYPISEAEKVLRMMQSGKNIGKAVLTITSSDRVPTLLQPKYSCYLDASLTYIIAGGLGGLGRSAARWMCQQGARNLILLSRSGPSSPVAQALVRELRGKGVSVETPRCDVSNSTSLSAALQSCAHMPPIKGCLQATMVLKDTLFENMSWEQWSSSIRSKVDSTRNLDTQLPKGLSFFIILSSISGITGSVGQSNYAAGNTYQDALAYHRLSRGEKAISIDLGLMGDVGIAAENKDVAKGREGLFDLAQIYETEFLALLDRYCQPDFQIEKPQHAQPIIGLLSPVQYQLHGFEVPDWLIERPLLRSLERFLPGDTSGLSTTDGTSGSDTNRDWPGEFSRTSSNIEAIDVVVEALIRKLSRATSIEVGDIDRTRPLHIYGVDSLLAVELRTWFSKVFLTDVAVFDIIGQASLEQIAEDAVSRSALPRNKSKLRETARD